MSSSSKRLVVLLAVLGASILGDADARAEGFLDLYIGGAFTADGDTVVNPASLATLGLGATSYGNSFSAGMRGGYWFDSLPWLGLAGDVSYFKPDAAVFFFSPDIDVVPLSALLMLRAPLWRSDEFPNGRLQPYGGIGPGLFISTFYESLPFAGGDFEDTQLDAGLDLHAGAEVLALPWLGVFLEYRFTWVEPEWQDTVGGVSTTVRSELATHHVQAGVGFHF